MSQRYDADKELLNNCKRGDMFYIEPVGGCGCEIQGVKTRPAIIISNNIGNKNSPVLIVVYTTTKEQRNYLPTHATVKGNNGIESTVLCEQICTVDKQRVKNYIRSCSKEEMARIDKALAVSIALNIENGIAEKVEAIESDFAVTEPLLKEAHDFINTLTNKCKRLNELDDIIANITSDSLGNLANILDEEALKEVIEVATRKVKLEREQAKKELAELLPKKNKPVAIMKPKNIIQDKVPAGAHKPSQSEQILSMTKEGKSVEEICTVLKIKKQAVYDTRNRAKKKGII